MGPGWGVRLLIVALLLAPEALVLWSGRRGSWRAVVGRLYGPLAVVTFVASAAGLWYVVPPFVRSGDEGAAEAPVRRLAERASYGSEGLDVAGTERPDPLRPREPTDDRRPTPAPTAGPEHATVAVQIHDGAGRAVPAVPVVLSGATASRTHSDAAGRVAFTVAPDRITVSVPAGCDEEVIVVDGGAQSLTVRAGDTHDFRLGISWRRRRVPTGPVYVPVAPPWDRGTLVRARVTLLDRCTEEPAASADFPYVDLVASPTLRLEDVAPRSTSAGLFEVAFRCVDAGPATLEAADRIDASDRRDLLSELILGSNEADAACS